MRNSALHRPVYRHLLGAVVALALAGTALVGCGEDSPDAVADDPTPTAAVSTSPTPTPSATPRPSPTAKPTKKPTKPAEGSGDSEGDDEPAAAGGGICTALSEDEVGAILGSTVAGSAIPGGGCAFTPSGPRPPAANLIEVPYADMDGGMDGAKENAISAVEGDPEDVSGIGDQAFVVTGTSFGGTDVQGAGAVRIGDRLISVNVVQSAGLKRAKVRALVLGLLRLAVTEAG